MFNVLYSLVNQTAAQAEFKVIWKSLVDTSYKRNPPHGLKHATLFLVTGGAGTFLNKETGMTYALDKPCAFFANARQLCSYECSADHWSLYTIQFSNMPVIYGLGLEPYRIYYLNAVEIFCRLAEQLISCLTSPSPKSGFMAEYFLSSILEHLSRHQDRNETADPKIQRVVHWMYQHIEHSISIDQLAKIGGMSRTALFQKFRIVTGMSPIDYFISLKLQSAASMLLNDDQNVAETATALGFCDEYYFSRQFKKKFGVSPGRYRRTGYVEDIFD